MTMFVPRSGAMHRPATMTHRKTDEKLSGYRARPSSGLDAIDEMLEIHGGQLHLRAKRGDWVDVACADTAPPGHPFRFTTAELVGYLTLAGGVVVAVVGVCSRGGCLLQLDASGRWLRCPARAAVYGSDGRVVDPGGHYRPPPLPLLQSRLAGGRLQALVPRAGGTT